MITRETVELYLARLRLCRGAAVAALCFAVLLMTYLNHRGTKSTMSTRHRPRRLDAITGWNRRPPELRAVGLLDVAATVIVAGSPARERFAIDKLGGVGDGVLVFFPF